MTDNQAILNRIASTLAAAQSDFDNYVPIDRDARSLCRGMKRQIVTMREQLTELWRQEGDN